MITRAIVLIPAGATPTELLQPIAGVLLLLRLLLLRLLPQRLEVEWIPNPSRVCAPLVVEETRAAVERGLFAGLQSASGGWVDRYVNRRLSPRLSRWLLRTPLTPNQVTLMSLVVGLIAALSFAQGGWLSGVAGALLLQWSAVIDCCDGLVMPCALAGKLGWFLWALAIGVNLFWPIVLGLAWKAQRTADG